MSAKPQKAAASAKTEAPEKKEKAPATKKIVTYTAARKLTEDDKLPKQMKVLFDVLANAGKKGLTRDEWAKQLEGVIETRQPITRIIGYYQSQMESRGMITITKSEMPA